MLMVEVFPRGDSLAHRAVERLLEHVVAKETEAPSHVFVECDEDEWRRHAVCLPAVTRRRSVLISASERALLDGVRLEIGGAVSVPVSTHSLTVACRAAAAVPCNDVVCMATRAVLEIVLSRASDAVLVGWRPTAFWTNQVGAPRLTRTLLDVARRLERIPAIVPGPFLVVTGRSLAEISEAAATEESVCGRPTPMPPAVFDGPRLPESSDRQRVDALLEASNAAGRGPHDQTMEAVRVLELPAGRHVGWWSVSPPVVTGGESWFATPAVDVTDGSVWRVEDQTGEQNIVEWTWSGSLAEHPGQVVRVPGWIGSTLREGRPAALLIEELARHSGRRGRPLWVPGVDAEAVRFLLSLPGPIWVDGPGVPSD